MSGALAIAMLLQPAPAMDADQADAPEIVVIANKFKTWRGTWKSRNGHLTCKTRKSSGDREVDALSCEHLVACATPIVPQMQAVADAKLPKAERNRQMAELSKPIGPCMTERRNDAIDALLKQRAAR